MDIAIDVVPEESTLSYDDTRPYEEQVPTQSEKNALANRIATNKVYLLSETTTTSRVNKRKHDAEDDADKIDEDEGTEEELGYRPNAILLKGSPIANLPTARIFAYATHFDTHPLGLEWVDDFTCVLVFESNQAARSAFPLLLKSSAEVPDMDELFAAKPFPVALWPPKMRIDSTLSADADNALKGPIRMRWARPDDVKKKGAKQESQFYKKHGDMAGKEIIDGRDLPAAKRRKSEHSSSGPTDAEIRAELDRQLDEFIADSDEEKEKDEDGLPPAGKSKMRSDYIDTEKRPRLDLGSRLMAPLPRRRRGQRGRGGSDEPEEESPRSSLADRLSEPTTDRYGRHDTRRGGGRRGQDGERRRGQKERTGQRRPRVTAEDLDADLDAFMHTK